MALRHLLDTPVGRRLYLVTESGNNVLHIIHHAACKNGVHFGGAKTSIAESHRVYQIDGRDKPEIVVCWNWGIAS